MTVLWTLLSLPSGEGAKGYDLPLPDIPEVHRQPRRQARKEKALQVRVLWREVVNHREGCQAKACQVSASQDGHGFGVCGEGNG